MLQLKRRTPAVLLGVIVCLTLFAGLKPTQAEASHNKFAAIAYSDQTGKYGYSYGKNCRTDAENDAMARCNADDARIVVWVEGGWVALAFGDNGTTGWGWSTQSLQDAKNIALDNCGCNPYIACWAASG